MSEALVPVAYYEDVALAQRHNDFLREQGITSVLQFPESFPTSFSGDREKIQVGLLVPEADYQAANEWLDEFEQTAPGKPASKGDRAMITGGITGMVGILASFGQFGEETGLVLGVAFSMIFIGGSMFVQGLVKNREEEGKNI